MLTTVRTRYHGYCRAPHVPCCQLCVVHVYEGRAENSQTLVSSMSLTMYAMTLTASRT